MKENNGAATTAVTIPTLKQCGDQRRKANRLRSIAVAAKHFANVDKSNFNEWNEINNGDKDALWWFYAVRMEGSLSFFQEVDQSFRNAVALWVEMLDLRGNWITGKVDGVLAVNENDDDL